MKLNAQAIEQIEIDSLLDVINRRLGYDFRHYNRSALIRRLNNIVSIEGVNSIAELIPKVLHQPQVAQHILSHMTIGVTEMFRDPSFFRNLQENIFPLLQDLPFFKVWHAGCSTGEEVYSLALLLEEHGLYQKARIYATDLNHSAINKAKQGVFNQEVLDKCQENYHAAGGRHSINNYIFTKYGSAKVDDYFKQQVTFASHNLVSDSMFAEMQLIICRNVLIYFDIALQNRVLDLFSQSLSAGGILCLGSKESLLNYQNASQFDVLSRQSRIFKKRALVNQSVTHYLDVAQHYG